MTTLESMCLVAKHFNALERPYVFLGAAVLPLLVDNAEVLEIRPTEDIDLSVEIANCSDPVKKFIVGELRSLLNNSEFVDAALGNFRSDSVSRERAELVFHRMHSLSQAVP